MKSFTPLILIAISIATYYMYIKPTYDEVFVLRDQKASHEEVLMKAKDIISKRDKIIAEYNSVSTDDLNKLKNILPDTFDNVSVTNHIDNIAAKYGLIIDQVKLMDQTENTVSAESVPNYKTHTMSFSTTGRYENFIQFLQDLESNNSVVDIKELNITPDVKDEKSNNMKYEIEFQTYSLN